MRVIGPAVSCSADTGIMPARLTRPRVGLWPTIPVIPDGQTIDPSVSLPIATWHSDAATATAEPDDEPHGFRSSTWGLRVWPPSADQPEVDARERKLAHSLRFALPSSTAPAARSRRTRVASGGRPAPSNAREPAVVGMPTVSILSLSSTGIPSSGPRSRPSRRRRSLPAACARAYRLTASTLFNRSSSERIRSR